jgi:uncharacterized membrane protein
MKWMTIVAVAGLVFGLAGCGETGKVKGPGGKELKLTAPGDTTIKQGDSKDVTVTIKRTKFDDPVDVAIADLPKGVSADADKKTVEKGASTVKFTLKADDDANPEDGHKVKVSAKAADMKEGPLEFTLNVKKK